MEKTIYGYILRYSKPQQIMLTMMAIASYPFLLWFLQVPKLIVNHINAAVDKKGVSFDVPIDFYGLVDYQMESIAYLLLLCGTFLILVLANQAFKYVINVYRGLTGERMLRRLRYDLSHHPRPAANHSTLFPGTDPLAYGASLPDSPGAYPRYQPGVVGRYQEVAKKTFLSGRKHSTRSIPSPAAF